MKMTGEMKGDVLDVVMRMPGAMPASLCLSVLICE